VIEDHGLGTPFGLAILTGIALTMNGVECGAMCGPHAWRPLRLKSIAGCVARRALARSPCDGGGGFARGHAQPSLGWRQPAAGIRRVSRRATVIVGCGDCAGLDDVIA